MIGPLLIGQKIGKVGKAFPPFFFKEALRFQLIFKNRLEFTLDWFRINKEILKCGCYGDMRIVLF